MYGEKPAVYKPRGLFLYRSDTEINEMHPLWKEIVLQAEKMSELHLLVFINNKKRAKGVIELSPTIFVYYISGGWFGSRLRRLWNVVHSHLLWRKSFHADFILNYSTGLAAIVGYVLAKRYRKKFFLHTSGTFVDLSPFSLERLRMRFLVRHADLVFVPGAEIAKAIVRHTGTVRRIVPIAPPIDLDFLKNKKEFFSYEQAHPGYSFFILVHVRRGYKQGLPAVLKTFTRLSSEYPRIALIILTPSRDLRYMQRIAHSHRGALFVHAETEDRAAMYGAGHIFLCAAEKDEINLPIIHALAVNVPVITTPAGMANDIFKNSRYSEYVCRYNDTECFYRMARKLIADQYVRNEYRLNTTLLLQPLSFQTIPGYINILFAYIQESI